MYEIQLTGEKNIIIVVVVVVPVVFLHEWSHNNIIVLLTDTYIHPELESTIEPYTGGAMNEKGS